MLYLFTNKFERKLNILDCEGIYYKGLFEKPKPGYLDFSENNAKADVALCLCEKYIINKDSVYRKEILKLYKTNSFNMRVIKNPEKSIDSICKYRKEVFMKMYNL